MRQRSKSPDALTGRQDSRCPLTVISSCGRMTWGGERGASCRWWRLIFQTVLFPQTKGHVIRGMSFLNFCSYLIGADQQSQGNLILECPAVHHNHVLLSPEGTSAAPSQRTGPGPSLGQAARFSPASNGVSGNAACSDTASEIPDMQLRKKVTAQSEQHIKH